MMKQWIEQTLPQQVEELQNLIRIPSVSRGEPKEGMPFGEEVHKALTYALDLANRLGFPRTTNLDGYCGYVDFGEGEEQLLIMSHLDVVPVGSGWTKEPFAAAIENGRMYGRGTIDDKGAAVSSLYALAAIKEAGIPLRRSVRILFGCDEERGSDCVKYYKTKEKNPTLGFTPDGEYPLVNAEKGITQTVWKKSFAGSKVSIQCGTAANVIPGEASATLPFAAEPVAVPEGYKVTFEGNTVSVVGRGGHASTPELGKNALQCLLEILTQQPLTGEDYATVTSLHALFGYDYNGEGFNMDVTDESGRLTLSLNVLNWDETGVSITCDCRHPFSVSNEDLMKAMSSNLNVLGFENVSCRHTPCLYMPEDSELVQGLLEVYEKNIGHKAKPLAIGGGTYARSFPNTVAFGVIKENGVNECHMPDESIGIDEMLFNTIVMAEAIEKLAGK